MPRGRFSGAPKLLGHTRPLKALRYILPKAGINAGRFHLGLSMTMLALSCAHRFPGRWR